MGPRQPDILHVDLDAFFAAVEVLLNPGLAGKPLVVGGRPGSRGVVSTASYEARKFGVHSAMPISRALRLCPQAVFLTPDFSHYHPYSERVFAVVRRFATVVQMVSIDEAFAVLNHADNVAAARLLKQEVLKETGLCLSVGLSTNRIVSKIASDYGKPDGFVVVPPGEEAAFLNPLPVQRLWGVGPKTAERLRRANFHTIGQLAAVECHELAKVVGARAARVLQEYANGIDHSRVHESHVRKSISQETTFQTDTADALQLSRVLNRQAEAIIDSLRKRGWQAQVVAIKLRYSDFTTHTRSLRLDQPFDDVETVVLAVEALMRRHWSEQRRAVRLIGVRISDFCEKPACSQPRLL